MLNFETIEPKRTADASVIFLHGLGANGHDLMGVIPMLQLPETHSIRFIFPHAPHIPITINGGMAMPGWYDITNFSVSGRQDLKGLESSRYHIDQLIEQEIARGIKPERIILGGFSQGGALTLFSGLQSPYPLAGMMVLSAYLPCAEYLKTKITAMNLLTPIFMAHGSQDPIVMYAWGETAKNELQHLGFAVQWHSYPMAHEISLPELQMIAKFIQSRLL